MSVKVGPVAPAALEVGARVPEREQEDVDFLLRFSERVQGRRPPLRRPEKVIHRDAVVVVGYQAVRRRPGGDTRTAAARRLAEKQPAARESRDPGGPSASSASNHAAPGLQRVRESLRTRAGDGEVRHGRPGRDARCVALDRGAQQPFGVVRPGTASLVAACGGAATAWRMMRQRRILVQQDPLHDLRAAPAP